MLAFRMQPCSKCDCRVLTVTHKHVNDPNADHNYEWEIVCTSCEHSVKGRKAISYWNSQSQQSQQPQL